MLYFAASSNLSRKVSVTHLQGHSRVTMTNPIVIRAAELTDIDHMTDVFFRSFNQGFWKHFCPDCAANRNFIADMWIMGLESSHDRTFVAIDTSASDAIVGFSRWQAPLYSRNKAYESWPEPSMLDQQIAIPFFASEDTNRNIVMGDRPHWCKQYHRKSHFHLNIPPRSGHHWRR